jgi:hypothetical protein
MKVTIDQSIRTLFGMIRFAPRALMPSSVAAAGAGRSFDGKPRFQSTALPRRQTTAQLDARLQLMTVKELRAMATAMKIKGRSKARRKAELVKLIANMKRTW